MKKRLLTNLFNDASGPYMSFDLDTTHKRVNCKSKWKGATTFPFHILLRINDI